MLDKSFYHFRDVGSTGLSLLFCCLMKSLLANNVDPDQMPQYVVSEMGLHCLPLTLFGVFR